MPPQLDYEEIAVRIHGFYMQANGDSDYAEFEKLPEFLKADNREAARRIGAVLSMAGLRLEPRNGEDWPPADLEAIRKIIEERGDLLAEAEHEGWVEARLRHGWRLADSKNVDRRESHLLVPYQSFPSQIERKQAASGPAIHQAGDKQGQPMTLDEEVAFEKEKDMHSVRNYVDIIACTNYRIVVEQ